MDFAKLPIGFAMALAQNTAALERFGRMGEPERKAWVDQARSARSESQMQQIVSGIADTGRM